RPDTVDIVVPRATQSVLKKVVETTANLSSYESISLFEISPADSSQVLPPDAELALANPADDVSDNARPAMSILEINEECLAVDICIDRYLWALYERAPKID